MKIVNKNLDHLIPYANNARTHSDEQIAQIAASLAEFGWCKPLVIHNGSMVAGHGTLRAAKILRDAGTPIPRWENNKEAPTVDVSHLSDTQRKAYILADNRISLSSSWDNDLLSLEMGALYEDDYDLKITGFNPSEIATLFGIELDDPSKEWDGMPEYDNEDQRSARQIVVHFKNDDDVEEFARRIGQSLTEKTKSIWFPEVQPSQLKEKRYAAGTDFESDHNAA